MSHRTGAAASDGIQPASTSHPSCASESVIQALCPGTHTSNSFLVQYRSSDFSRGNGAWHVPDNAHGSKLPKQHCKELKRLRLVNASARQKVSAQNGRFALENWIELERWRRCLRSVRRIFPISYCSTLSKIKLVRRVLSHPFPFQNRQPETRRLSIHWRIA